VGVKALTANLGDDRATERSHDAVALIKDGPRTPARLADQGDANQFLVEQLRPELLKAAWDAAGIDLTLRMQPGHDHSYYFIASFIGAHIAHHAKALHG
jgi:S-formylglutathione hydrolase